MKFRKITILNKSHAIKPAFTRENYLGTVKKYLNNNELN
jgi:hypothetical protein